MLDIVQNYRTLLENIDVHIEKSIFKKDYLIRELGISRATFYNKLKKRSFSVSEMLKLTTILFPEEAKAFEIKSALDRSKVDSKSQRTKNHSEVIKNARKRIAE